MTKDERNQIAKLITASAFYYHRQITPEVVNMMIDDLEGVPFNQLLWAYNSYRKNPKNRTFPIPAQIREMICPEVTPDDQAREIASRITSAISKFGYSRGAEAREYIGQIGWEIVKRNGGWQPLCEGHGIHFDKAQFSAQSRDLAKSMIASNARGEFDKPIHFAPREQIESSPASMLIEKMKVKVME